MILDIDAGNTRIKWRVCSGGRVIAHGHQFTAENRQGIAIEITDIDSVERIRLASVAGLDIIDNLHRQLAVKFNVPVELAEVSGSGAGIVCGYKDHLELGVDRWLAMVAAYSKDNNAVIVVDAGSAVTIDIVGGGGKHRGGYIVPGLQLMCESLWWGTDRIKVVGEQAVYGTNPGVTTDQAVDSGCLLLLVATIEYLVAQYQTRLVITGGDGLAVLKQLTVEAEYHPELVLEGLAVEGVVLRVLR